MSHDSPLVIGFVRVVGGLWAQTFGRLDRYTGEHREFLSSGFVCQKCHERLIGNWLIADVKCYDSTGGTVPLMQARLRGRYFECPKCLHRWPFRLPSMKFGNGIKVVIGFLIVALVTALGFLAYARWQNFMWEMEVFGLAGDVGTSRAGRDFRAGKTRLFVLAGERDEDKFSGTNDGPFEVWYPQYFPQYYPFRYGKEQDVEFYNRRMRYMHEHPEKSNPQTNATTQIMKP